MKMILSLCLLPFLFFCYGAELYAGQVVERPDLGCYLSVPKQAAQDKAAAVLICLPGWGIKAKNDINSWAFPSDKKGLLVVDVDINYPAINSDSDVGLLYLRIQDILSCISKVYNIDQNNISIAGTSAGGMMAIALALRFPGKFKAIAAVSAGRLGFGADGHLNKARGQLFYFYQGQRDRTISLGEFYSTKKRLEKNGAVVEYKVMPELEHALPSSCYKEVVDWLYQLQDMSL